MSEFRNKIDKDRDFAFKVAWELLKDPEFKPITKDFGDLTPELSDYLHRNPSPDGWKVVLKNITEYNIGWFGPTGFVKYLFPKKD